MVENILSAWEGNFKDKVNAYIKLQLFTNKSYKYLKNNLVGLIMHTSRCCSKACLGAWRAGPDQERDSLWAVSWENSTNTKRRLIHTTEQNSQSSPEWSQRTRNETCSRPLKLRQRYNHPAEARRLTLSKIKTLLDVQSHYKKKSTASEYLLFIKSSPDNTWYNINTLYCFKSNDRSLCRFSACIIFCIFLTLSRLNPWMLNPRSTAQHITALQFTPSWSWVASMYSPSCNFFLLIKADDEDVIM